MSLAFEIIVGTYEQFVLGYTINGDDYQFRQTFATHSHLGSVRTVDGGRRYLASGGADDVICLYDMRHRRESGKLTHHNDTVNCVSFTPDSSHLLSCSGDGSVAVVRCGNWQLDKHWRDAHKGSCVNTLAVHPSGKLALTAGADGTLRTWNLVKGRQAYATNLTPRLKADAKHVTIIKWSPRGERYVVAANRTLLLYSVRSATVERELLYESKVVCAEFLGEDFIVSGHEDGKVRTSGWNGSKVSEMSAHEARVKCMAAHEDGFLVSASSCGQMKLWRIAGTKLKLLNSGNCGARISCLSLMSRADWPAKKQEDASTAATAATAANKRRYPGLRLEGRVVVEDEDDRWIVQDVDESNGHRGDAGLKRRKRQKKGRP